ncbi:MAG: PHP domain-containing protein [Fastidiosipilaceae bacterium]|jgi:predicted metal-dependent phosphoesterase TrpH|nr:PHP domain-containing protein [Clostridiaceae bacterium]
MQKITVEYLRERILGGACDLHMHTTASDGGSTPALLAEEVIAAGLRTIALTDHDTIEGIEPLHQRLKIIQASRGISTPTLISGVEFSVDWENQKVHLLGYVPEEICADLQPYIDSQQQKRRERNIQMCKRLEKLGISVTIDEVEAVGNGQNAGRPHIAKLMQRKNYVASLQEAFDDWLGKGRPAYVPRRSAPLEEAVQEIRHCQGVAVIAHPQKYGWTKDRSTLFGKFKRLKEVGVVGIETIHGEMPLNISRFIADVADDLELLKTIGSDYHGNTKPHVRLYTKDDDFSSYLA